MPPVVCTKMFENLAKFLTGRQLINVVLPEDLTKIKNDNRELYAAIQDRPAIPGIRDVTRSKDKIGDKGEEDREERERERRKGTGRRKEGERRKETGRRGEIMKETGRREGRMKEREEKQRGYTDDKWRRSQSRRLNDRERNTRGQRIRTKRRRKTKPRKKTAEKGQRKKSLTTR